MSWRLSNGSEIAGKEIEVIRLNENGKEPFQHLSKKEKEMMQQPFHGLGHQEIADYLFVSMETVHTQIHNLYKKPLVISAIQALRKRPAVNSCQPITMLLLFSHAFSLSSELACIG